jgi:hypothetical protein
MQVFASERQQTWLLADAWKAYCVLDDRKWEEPRIQWRTKLTSAQPVHVDENWSTEAGMLHFGSGTNGWLYSKELFKSEPVAVAINRFPSAPEN